MVFKRIDSRKVDELRPIEARAGILSKADGSAYFKIGDTIAYAAVYGPRELHPKFLQNPETGILRCNYNMMPFSSIGERVRPGPSRRSREISFVTENALNPVLDLKEFPNAVVDVFIELLQTDAGSRCAGICAASIALADAGLPIKDLVASVSVGYIDKQIIVDVNGYEDCKLGVTDIPMAIIPTTGEICLLQLDGDIPKEELKKALEIGKKSCLKIYEIQKKALKEKFKLEGAGK